MYHVIQRGNNREYIFQEHNNKKHLINKLVNYKERFKFKLYGFVIMSNHYHLVIQTEDVPLQKIMHGLNNSYSKHYNFQYRRTGHVFERRYKAILVQDERYLLALLRYVHQNPIRVGICNHVWQYQWSSDMFYRQNLQGAVDFDFVLNMLPKTGKKALKNIRIS